MTEILAKLKTLGKATQKSPHMSLEDELTELRRQVASIDSCYNMIQDGDLMDSLIYQRIALTTRYEYLLRQAKAQNIVSSRPRISVK